MLEVTRLRIVKDNDAFDTGGDEVIDAAARRLVPRDDRRRDVRAARPRERVQRGDGLRLRADRLPRGDRGIRAVRAPVRGRHPPLPARYGPAEDVPVELRGAGRRVAPGEQLRVRRGLRVRQADRRRGAHAERQLELVSPHRHDELEEIYYFEITGGGFAYQRVYDGMELLAEVRSGDRIDLPQGYHGPSMAAPGYDLYYLNVMAGSVREWNFVDDPAHAWIRGTWADQEMDPRLPMTSANRRRTA